MREENNDLKQGEEERSINSSINEHEMGSSQQGSEVIEVAIDSVDVSHQKDDSTQQSAESLHEADEAELSSVEVQLIESKRFIKKSQKKIIVGVSILMVAMLLFMGISYAMVRSNPVLRTYTGLKHFQNMATFSMAMDIELEMDDTPAVDTLFDEMDFTAYIQGDINSSSWLFALTSEFQEDPFADIVVMMEDNIVYFDIPQMFEEDAYYYYDISEYMEAYEENTRDFDHIQEDMNQFMSYLKRVDFSKLNVSKYADIIYKELETHITSDFDSVTYHLDMFTLVDLLTVIIEEAAQDEVLFDWLIESMDIVFEAMIEDEFEMPSMEIYTEDIVEIYDEYHEQIDNAESLVEFRQEFYDKLRELLDDMDENRQSMEEMMSMTQYGDMQPTYDITFYFNLFNQVEKVEVIFEMGDVMQLAYGFTYGLTYEPIRSYNTDDGIDLQSFIDSGDLSEIENIQKLIFDYIEDYQDDNEAFEAFVEEFQKRSSFYYSQPTNPLYDHISGQEDFVIQ